MNNIISNPCNNCRHYQKNLPACHAQCRDYQDFRRSTRSSEANKKITGLINDITFDAKKNFAKSKTKPIGGSR